MSNTMTRVVANVTRHETVVYVFEGDVDHEEAMNLIESGDHDPEDSHVHVEDVDIVDIVEIEGTD
jgi:hypothetical protein